MMKEKGRKGGRDDELNIYIYICMDIYLYLIGQMYACMYIYVMYACMYVCMNVYI